MAMRSVATCVNDYGSLQALMYEEDPASSQHNLYDIYLWLCVQCWTFDDTEKLSETYRVLFQNKFEKLVRLVGFIIRILQNCYGIVPTFASGRSSAHGA
jgi:hypothetical protein